MDCNKQNQAETQATFVWSGVPHGTILGPLSFFYNYLESQAVFQSLSSQHLWSWSIQYTFRL